jgi:hyperosmotically inducible periplasmic protein
MKEGIMYSPSKGFGGLCSGLLLSVVLTGCQSTTGKTANQTVSDASISTAVQAELTRDRVSNFPRIDVDTERGIVYLSGIVETEAQRAHAERLAWRVEGVRKVNNNLQIQNRLPAGKPVQPEAKSAHGERERPSMQGVRGIQGEVLRVDGENYVVKSEDGREVRLHADAMTVQTEKIQSGDRIEAKIDHNNHAVSLMRVR